MKIGNRAYRISLVNVLPAYDREVRDRFAKVIGNANKIHHHIITALGPFDIVLFSMLEDTGGYDTGINPLPLDVPVTGFTSIMAFEIEHPSFELLDSTLQEPVLAVSSLKLNNVLTERIGIDADDIFYSLCSRKIGEQKQHGTMSATVLGNLGWYDSLIVIGGINIQRLVRFVIELRRLTIADLEEFLHDLVPHNIGKGIKDQPILQTSYTIPCINDETLDILNESDHDDIVNSRIFFVCRPGMAPTVAGEVMNTFETSVDRRNVVGKGEVAVDVQMSFPKLVRTLQQFREDYGDKLIETETTIEIDMEDTDTRPSLSRTTLSRWKTLRVHDLSPLAEVDSYLHDRLVQLYRSVAGRMSDEVAVGSYADLVGYVKELTKKRIVTPITEDFLRVLSQMCDVLFYGLEQRFRGSNLSMDQPTELPDVRHEGGIQRVLLAAQEVTRQVVEAGGGIWTGFCMFGWLDDFLRFEKGAINLPWRTLLRPNDWWPLFHEAGHDYAEIWKLDSDEGINHIFKAALDIDIKQIDDEQDLEETKEETLLFWEILADFVDFHVGFRRNLTDYLIVTWHYLDDHWSALDSDTRQEQLLRTFLLSYVTPLRAQRGALSTYGAFKKKWLSLPSQINSEVVLHNIESIIDVSQSSVSFAWEKTTHFISICRYLQDRFLKSIQEDDDCSEIIHGIMQGEPCRSVESPISLIRTLALMEAGGTAMGLRTRLAAILTLWSTWKVKTPTPKLIRIEYMS